MLQYLFSTRKSLYVPNRYQKEVFELCLSGTRLRLHLPLQATDFKFQVYKQDIDIKNSCNYFNRLGRITGAYPEINIIQQTWDLKQDKYLNPIGVMDFTCKVVHATDMAVGTSCFNPRHLEEVIARRIFHLPENSVNSSLLSNWKVYYINRIVWPYCEFEQSSKKLCEFYAPIDDHHFIAIRFEFRFESKDKYKRERDAIHSLTHEIMRTIRMHFSPEVKTKITYIRALWPNVCYSRCKSFDDWSHRYDLKTNSLINKLGKHVY